MKLIKIGHCFETIAMRVKLITLTVKEYGGGGGAKKESWSTGVWLTGLLRQELEITESLEMS